MLTAKTQVLDRVVGLKLGADDYLAKPFEPPNCSPEWKRFCGACKSIVEVPRNACAEFSDPRF